ncbi:MAG: hypothetical protein HY286_16625 [Planctomycetes bacterium]|nr:hypothetical protein [Planctomycetota bacterium]
MNNIKTGNGAEPASARTGPALGPGGFAPAFATARFYQPIRVRARDRIAHTTMAATERRGYLFNRPILESTTICFPRRALGKARLPQFQRIHLNCAMHAGETGDLLVFAHPYYTISDAEGKFRIAGLPAGTLTICADEPDLGVDKEPAAVAARAETRVDLRLRKRD